MSKYTYLIEYYKKEAPSNVYQTLWSDDEELDKSFVIKEKDVHNIYLNDSKKRLGGYLTMFPNSEQAIRCLWYQEKKWEIKIKVCNVYKNTFNNKECEHVPDSFNSYLKSLSKGMFLLEFQSLTNEDVDDYVKKLNEYDVALITNYFYVKALSPFIFDINKVKTLNEILLIVKDVEHILEKSILNYDYSEHLAVAKGAHHDLRFALSSEIHKLSDFFASLTKPLGFEYRYTPYISFSQFFRRLKRLVEMEMEYRIATTDNKEEIAQVDYSKWFSKDEIITELVPYKYNEQFKRVLDSINHRYKLQICTKLDIATILLLLREYCTLLNKDKVRTFKKFMALMCHYLDLPTTSYKENDCVERRKEILRMDKYFWETTIAKKFGRY